MQRVQAWQWLNIVGLDAAAIGMAWLYVFAKVQRADIQAPAYIVLGLSVWLSYLADRLFDVRGRSITHLLSARHQFTKRYARVLWPVWWSTLIVNCIIAFTTLHSFQLKKGALLLALCLSYTFLNQRLSKHFFPKEICVALIFAGGITVFLEGPLPLPECLTFAMICLINCLMISSKEKVVDSALATQSVSQYAPASLPGILMVLTALLLPWLQPGFQIPILATLVSFAFITISNTARIGPGIEGFRVLLDSLLLVGPLTLVFR